MRPVIAALVLSSAAPASSQISTDGSVGPQVDIALESGEYRILETYGRPSGENLFHSFSTFDVGGGETATFFADGTTFARVIARVTGGDGTKIDGTLRSIGGSDLFLLDSRGVTFGEDSQLDVDGSFYTSSADLLRFAQGPDFVTADPSPDPLLSAAAPAAFGFTSESPAPMLLDRSDRLSVPESKTLSIVGGDVFVIGEQGGSIVIDAPGAQVEIASAGGPIDIPVRLGDLDVETAPPEALGTVEFVAATALLSGIGAVPAGGVMIRAGEFVFSSGSAIVAQNESNADAVGPIDIAVSGDLRLVGNDTLIQSWTQGEGAAGDVLLSGDRVEISDGAQLQLFSTSPVETGEAPNASILGRVVEIVDAGEIEALSLSAGPGSHIDITARESITIAGDDAAVVNSLLEGHAGEPGRTRLDAPEVIITGSAQLSTLNASDGAGSLVEVYAAEVEVSDGGGILTESTGSDSQGGKLNLVVGELAVTDAGAISSITAGGHGGDIEIAADHLLVSNAANRPEGSSISAYDGGSTSVDADLVELLDGGQIITSALADSPAGTLEVAADTVLASGLDAQNRPSGLFSRTQSASESGAGGPLFVDTRILEVTNGAQISSATFGVADAGLVDIDASERVTVSGGSNGFSLVSAGALPQSSGSGGFIEIDTPLLELRDGGQVTTSTFGTGDAGEIVVRADRIEVSGVDPLSGSNQSGFFSQSNNPLDPSQAGDGGNIGIIATQSLLLSDGALVSASATGAGLAGNVFIDAGQLFQMQDATISTQAAASIGGNVKVTADSLVYLNRSTIRTNVLGGTGRGGDVTIDPVHTVLNHSSITANAIGDGGNLLIQTDHYFQSGDSFLSASSELGIDGTIQVTAPDTDLTGGLARLPATYLDASALLERDCAARTERAGSFAVRVQALPPAPDEALTESDAGYCPLSEEKP